MAPELIPKIVAQLYVIAKAEKERAKKRRKIEVMLEKQRIIQDKVDRLVKLKEIDWEHFCGLAANWKTANHLSEFLSEIKSKMLTGDYQLDGLPLADWVELAEVRIEELNPFNRIMPAVDDAKDRDKD